MGSEKSVARAYAEALVKIGQERGTLEPLHGEMAELKQSLGRDPAVIRFLETPDVTPAAKIQALERALAGRVSALFLNFLRVVVGRRRGGLLPDVFEQFAELYDKATGRIRVVVEAPLAVREELASRLRAAVQRKTGLSPVIEFREVPAHLGGLLVVAGDTLFDATLRRDLRQLETGIRQNILRQQEVFA